MAAKQKFPFGPSDTAQAYHISLHCQEAGSDKIYEISIKPEENGLFSVTYANGPRGKKLVTGTKTPNGPVAYEEAKDIASSLLASKIKKNYNPINSLTGHFDVNENVPIRTNDTGLRFKELSVAKKETVVDIIRSPEYCIQEKYNGHRRPIFMDKTISPEITGTNRRGIVASLPENVVKAFRKGETFLLDGELMNDEYVAYDILKLGDKDLRDLPYVKRLAILWSFSDTMIEPDMGVRIAVTALSIPDKSQLIADINRRNGEGIVIKNLNASYQTLRDDAMIKHKFWNSLSAVVTGQRDGKRSVSIALYDGGKYHDIGHLTIPNNHDIPPPGSVVEVIYQHAVPDGGLISPRLERIRDDVLAEECTLDQRVFENPDNKISPEEEMIP